MSVLLARSSQHAGMIVKAVHSQCHIAQAKLHTVLQDETIRPKHTLYVVLACLTSAWLALIFITRLRHRTRQSTTRPSTPNLEKHSSFKAADRKPGGMLSTHLPPCYKYRLWLRYPD